MCSLTGNMLPLVLLLTFLLSPEAGTEEIIGGHEAKPHSRPYMAYVTYMKEGQGWICGGALVQEKFVLTAAHCKGSSMKVLLGAHDIWELEKTQQLIPVIKPIPHPYCKKINNITYNDIMLLQLKRKAILTKAVQLLRLPRVNSQVKPGALCEVAGWGRLAPNGQSPSKLQEVKVMVQKDEKCQTQYRGVYNSTTQMCVGDPKIKNSAFSGDSGGPLICNAVVQGIVSYGKPDGEPPSVYTKVSTFIKWIQETMNQH